MTTSFTELMVVRALGDDEFLAEPAGQGFLYGGLTMGMAMTAAAVTVADDLVPMALRCSFLSFGTWGPTDVTIERVSTSRSFATRRAQLRQGDALVAVVDLTFHRVQAGRDVQHAPAPSIRPPDALAPVRVVFGSAESDAVDPFEVRPLRGDTIVMGDRFHPFWGRAREPLGERPALHDAALTFLSDYRVIHSPFEPGSGDGQGLRSFTLEHSLWFHRPCNANQWMAFECAPLTESGGRYVSRGTVHDEEGALLASFVQEGFIRPA